jgi:copper(I)-binding protein
VNRAVRAVAIGALVLSPVALSACSAGQVSQTATQQRDKTGGDAAVGNITVREARLAYPVTRSFSPGGNALLQMGLVNSGDVDDVLTNVTGDAFSGIAVTPTTATAPTGAAAATASAAPSTTAAASSNGPVPSTGLATSAAAPTATGAVPTGQTAAPPSVTSGGGISIPADGNVYIGSSTGPAITLTGLTQTLTAGQAITVQLTFQRAGTVSVTALVGTPSSDARATPYDFNPTESEEQRGGGAG